MIRVRVKKTRQIKNLEPRFDSIETEKALDAYEAEISNARSGEPLPGGELDFEHYCAVHHHLFQDVYAWAGQLRTVRMSKQGNPFCYLETRQSVASTG